MSGRKRVLVVDDNPINLAIIEEMLSADYELSFAQNGLDAIRIAVRRQPAVIMLDVMMPDVDGLETCRRIRRTDAIKDTPIVMLSAKAMPSECEAGMHAGADDYITKPFDESELLRVLWTHTQRHPPSDA